MTRRILTTTDCLAEGAEWLGRRDPRFVLALPPAGLPWRQREQGFTALLGAADVRLDILNEVAKGKF